jgi:nuclear pore complex protein Nup98-Nup96
MMVGGFPAMDGPKNSILNIFDGLDWLKCLALQLWYVSSPTSSITDAVMAYELDFNRDAYEIASPSPSYVKQLDQKDSKYQDIRFHLLKLFSQRGLPLEVLLHPANYTMDLMDNRLAFLILQVLDTLGYQHLSESCRLKIYTSFAEQLETNDLWEWSVWTMLHIVNQNHREIAVQQLLYRHIRIDGETDEEYMKKESFISEQLMIPEKWIHWAKAVRAGAMGNHHVEVKYLLKAHQWSKAHDVMMQFIAPDLVINDQIDFLKSLLEQFQNTKEIQNWKFQGQILKHFIELNERVRKIIVIISRR